VNGDAPTQAATVTPKDSLWRELGAALRGTQADYTKIPLRRAVFLLAIPMMLELVLESTFAVVDIFFVAKLGASAVATVGLTETYLFILYSVAMGLATAVTAIVARCIGRRCSATGTVGGCAAARIVGRCRSCHRTPQRYGWTKTGCARSCAWRSTSTVAMASTISATACGGWEIHGAHRCCSHATSFACGASQRCWTGYAWPVAMCG
jgi:hypothetical protein